MNADSSSFEKAIAQYLINQMDYLNNQQERLIIIADYMLSTFTALSPDEQIPQMLKQFPELEPTLRTIETVLNKTQEEQQKDDVMQKLREIINKR